MITSMRARGEVHQGGAGDRRLRTWVRRWMPGRIDLRELARSRQQDPSPRGGITPGPHYVGQRCEGSTSSTSRVPGSSGSGVPDSKAGRWTPSTFFRGPVQDELTGFVTYDGELGAADELGSRSSLPPEACVRRPDPGAGSCRRSIAVISAPHEAGEIEVDLYRRPRPTSATPSARRSTGFDTHDRWFPSAPTL